ncbi:MAG: hypothetical protein KDB36_18215 [Acidimicrobiales bacterium]|nr:hypothetical protein [Acidimicrobiales bacterium]
MRATARTVAAIGLSATVLLAGACSSSGESGTSTTAAPTTEAPGTTGTTVDAQLEAFCAEADDKAAVIGSDDMDPLDNDSFGEFVDAFLDVGQLAPPAIQDDWDTVSELIEDLYAMAPSEREGTLETIASADDFNDAQDAVNAFMDEHCGFTFEDDGGDDDGGTTGTTQRRGTTTTAGEISTDTLQAYLEDGFADEPWFDQINGYLIGSSDAGIDVTVSTVSSWTVDDALSVCEAVAGWLDDLADDGTVTIEDADGALAERPAGDSDCAEA